MSTSKIVLSSDCVFEKAKSPLFILGPCSLQDEETTRKIATKIKELSKKLSIPVVFKGSYRKANRTKYDAFHGVGLMRGMELLKLVKEDYCLPVTSDVHETIEIEKAAEVLDLIQIPADLCKHTFILFAAADTKKPVNIKKGLSITPQDMEHAIEKITSRGNNQIILTERGTLFGYSDIIVDFRSIQIMQSFGYPVIFDTSHSVRILSRRSDDPLGAKPEFIPLLTSSAAAAGADGLFVETHYSIDLALSDSSSCCLLADLENLITRFMRHWNLSRSSYGKSS